MKINTQLNISFAVVLFVPMICAAVFSVVYFSQKITEAAVSKIHSDSKAADIIFHDSLTEMKHLATAYAQKKTVIMLINFNLGEKVTAGKRFFDPLLSDKLYGRLTPGDVSVNREKDIADKYETLTPREQEVMRLLLRKLSLKEISYELRISYKTASVHKSNLMKSWVSETIWTWQSMRQKQV